VGKKAKAALQARHAVADAAVCCPFFKVTVYRRGLVTITAVQAEAPAASVLLLLQASATMSHEYPAEAAAIMNAHLVDQR
jgi:hypothetical protein